MSPSNLARWAFAALLGLVLSVPASVALGPSAQASAQAAPTQSCGALKSGGHVYAKKVTAKNISCRKAKREIRVHFLPGMDLNGYRCTGYPRQTCSKGRVVIAFTYP